MGDDLIRYDLLVQEALRGVVRKVLSAAARDGLPGSHYFHVEFLTASPGVKLSDRMRERFPERMTIILQHHFWDLEVTEEALEVGLSFGGVGERVRVPFAAVTGFFDESVQFGLRFEVEDRAKEAREEDKQPDPQQEKAGLRPLAASEDKPAPQKRAAEKREADAPSAPEESPTAEPGEGGAKVLSLNAFRKKP